VYGVLESGKSRLLDEVDDSALAYSFSFSYSPPHGQESHEPDWPLSHDGDEDDDEDGDEEEAEAAASFFAGVSGFSDWGSSPDTCCSL